MLLKAASNLLHWLSSPIIPLLLLSHFPLSNSCTNFQILPGPFFLLGTLRVCRKPQPVLVLSQRGSRFAVTSKNFTCRVRARPAYPFHTEQFLTRPCVIRYKRNKGSLGLNGLQAPRFTSPWYKTVLFKWGDIKGQNNWLKHTSNPSDAVSKAEDLKNTSFIKMYFCTVFKLIFQLVCDDQRDVHTVRWQQDKGAHYNSPTRLLSKYAHWSSDIILR